jgi:hypothetical protein
MKLLMGKEEAVLYNILAKITEFFRVKTERDFINEYLADASDLIDLENRLRQIDRNQAPWQVKAKQYVRTWVQQ